MQSQRLVVAGNHLILFIFLIFLFTSPSPRVFSKEITSKHKNHRAILSTVSSVHIPFIENKGQIENGEVKFYAKTIGGTVFVSRDGELVDSLRYSSDPLFSLADLEVLSKTLNEGTWRFRFHIDEPDNVFQGTYKDKSKVIVSP